MSTVTIPAGGLIILDPSDKRVVIFDWDTDDLAPAVTIATSTFTISTVTQNGATILTKDTPSILTGSRKTQVRLLATTATKGDRYLLANTIVTNESPAQTKEQSIQVLVEDR